MVINDEDDLTFSQTWNNVTHTYLQFEKNISNL